MEREELKNHKCIREDSWWEYDARGIPLARVCDICAHAKLSVYRPEVLSDPNYYTDEPINLEKG